MFTHKLVTVLNQSIDQGVAMNALAHMVLGLGNLVPKQDLKFDNYQDANNFIYPNISQMPFIVLKGSGIKIRGLVHQLRDQSIMFTAFVHTMTGGTYLEQLQNTRETFEEELQYYGVSIFGEWQKVSDLTRKFSLWK